MVANKKEILSELMKELTREYENLHRAALEAREAAISEEAKPENEYDTRGLEASYLAGAQAHRANEIKSLLALVKTMAPRSYTGDEPIGTMSLVKVRIDDQDERLFFMVPFESGHELKVKGSSILCLSLDSPLGRELKGQKVGHEFSFKVKDFEKDYEVIGHC